MKEIVTLKNEYINVNSSYGGSQQFFSKDEGLMSRGKRAGGCGVVALNDCLAYLKGATSYESIPAYKKAFNKTARKVLFIPSSLGMSYIQLFLGAKALLFKASIKLKSSWCFSRKKAYLRISDMLSNNLPVILGIPKIFVKHKKDSELSFYDCTLLKVNQTHGHFVVITGIYSEESKIYFSISSWGRKYFISYDELMAFLKKHPASLLGFMLYLR